MGDLRIVAGTLRGRRIRVPDDAAFRPTGDRVREALFNILGQQLDGWRVIDAYAGSGALGFEALSRGAAFVHFWESDPGRVEAIRGLAERFGVSARCDVESCKVLHRLRAWSGLPAELILADPPYDSGERHGLVKQVERGGEALLAAGGLLVIERPARGADKPPRLQRLALRRSAVYGVAALDLYGWGEIEAENGQVPQHQPG